MKKILICFLGLMVCATSLFSKPWNIYDGADAKTLKKIQKCDEYISKKEFSDAVNTVISCENEYIIYKYVEVITKYATTSIFGEGQDFLSALDNLEEIDDSKELLNDNEIIFSNDTPEDVITDYIENNDDSFIAQLALSNYYFYVLSNYGDFLEVSQNDAISIMLDSYDQALVKEIYDETTLENYSYLCMNFEEYELASEILKLLSRKYYRNGTYWYELGIVSMYLKNYEDAVYATKRAVYNPVGDENSDLDSYILLSDAYAYSGDLKNAKRILLQAIKKYPNNPYPVIWLGDYYLCNREVFNTGKAAKYFDYAIKNYDKQNLVYVCVDMYYSKDFFVDAISFCNRNIKKLDDPSKLAFLHYYLAELYCVKDEPPLDDVYKEIDLAQELFESIEDEEWVYTCEDLREFVTESFSNNYDDDDDDYDYDYDYDDDDYDYDYDYDYDDDDDYFDYVS